MGVLMLGQRRQQNPELMLGSHEGLVVLGQAWRSGFIRNFIELNIPQLVITLRCGAQVKQGSSGHKINANCHGRPLVIPSLCHLPG